MSGVNHLCTMASKFPQDNLSQLRQRKGHDMTWSCDKHGEPIKFYCKKHKIPVCHPCATKDHSQKPCELDDIEDVILESRKKLDEKKPNIDEANKKLANLHSKLACIETSSNDHLNAVNDEIQVVIQGSLKSTKDKEIQKIRRINLEADEEIRLINERREKQITACNTEIEKELQHKRDKEASLLADVKTIRELVSNKIRELTSKNQHEIEIVKNIESTITRIKQNDETLVNEAPQVLTSIDENLSLNVHQDVSDCLDRIQREVWKVEFTDDGDDEEYKIRFTCNWCKLVKSIHIPFVVNQPVMHGLISDDEICVFDRDTNNMYITDLSTGNTHQVTDGDQITRMSITSIAPIDSNIIVCGKEELNGESGSLYECLTLYDRHDGEWKVISEISIPNNGDNYIINTDVYVDVDRDGMILAAQCEQSSLYVINPADGKIVNTITMPLIVLGRMQALSSGDIVVKTCYDEFTIISRSGEKKAVIRCDEWHWAQCQVDKMTDTLYITYQDKTPKTVAVDTVSCDGIIQARRIIQYVKSDRSDYIMPCLVTPSGNLVVCDGDKVHTYNKEFIS
ncbi:uncharacterized protein LOC135155071 [Lytechinus pictus]|uniref:uncharacterized protein LOC135155071 n=1 Tax=Lytechinus pictus TaxID=7653 RepID=UPI0030BA1297